MVEFTPMSLEPEVMEKLFHILNSHQPAQSPRLLHILLMESLIPTLMLKLLRVDSQLLLMKQFQLHQDLLPMLLSQLQKELVLTLKQFQLKLLPVELFLT
jgi:hypothetical protein